MKLSLLLYVKLMILQLNTMYIYICDQLIDYATRVRNALLFNFQQLLPNIYLENRNIRYVHSTIQMTINKHKYTDTLI